MRTDQFLEAVRDSQIIQNNGEKVQHFINNDDFGGWEVWLQCEIGYYLSTRQNPKRSYREQVYQQIAHNNHIGAYIRANGDTTAMRNQAAKADFLVTRNNGGDRNLH